MANEANAVPHVAQAVDKSPAATEGLHSAFKGRAVNGPCQAWGICWRDTEGEVYVVYEPMFVAAAARRLAELSNAQPTATFEHLSRILEAEGFDLTDPGEVALRRKRARHGY